MISINKNFSDKNFNDDIKDAINKKDTAALLSSLSDEDKKLLDTLLKDEKAREEFLSSSDARKIISALFGSR